MVDNQENNSGTCWFFTIVHNLVNGFVFSRGSSNEEVLSKGRVGESGEEQHGELSAALLQSYSEL